MSIAYILPKVDRGQLVAHDVSRAAIDALNDGTAFTEYGPTVLEDFEGVTHSTTIHCNKCGFRVDACPFLCAWRHRFGSDLALVVQENIPHPEFKGTRLLILATWKSAAKLLAEMQAWRQARRCCRRDGTWYRKVIAATAPELT
jgi:hypothetical protein